MQLVERHIINSNHFAYNECDKICFASKNLYNKANYIVRQEFIKTTKEKQEGLREYAIYLNYFDIRRILINSDEYKSLPRKVSNQTLMMLDRNWKSFFKSIKDYVKHPNKYTGKPSLPRYLNPQKGRFITTYELGAISGRWLKQDYLALSQSNIKIPIRCKNVKQCRITPRNNEYIIDVIYEVEDPKEKNDNERYAGIDLGVNNLATVGSNVVEPFIVNGRPLKSINQFYNKKLAYYKSILEKNENKKTSGRLVKLTNKRDKKVKDYLHKSSRIIVNKLVENNINTLVIGKNDEWKQRVNMSKANNQNFVSIPHSTFIQMLEYKAKLVGIRVVIQEESYTSKCSFFDLEEVRKQQVYKGRRLKRGLFKTSMGRLVNADLNGSYNIIKKAIPNAFSYGIEGLAVNPVVLATN